MSLLGMAKDRGDHLQVTRFQIETIIQAAIKSGQVPDMDIMAMIAYHRMIMEKLLKISMVIYILGGNN